MPSAKGCHGYCLGLFLSFFLLCFNSYSQEPLNIRIKQPSPFNFGVKDIFNVTISRSRSSGSQLVYLKGSVEKIGAGVVGKFKTSPMKIELSKRTILRKSQIDITRRQFFDKRFEKQFRSSPMLPSGEYILCVDLIAKKSGQKLGSHCLEFTGSNQSPPRLANPRNGQTLSTSLPLLSWLAPSPRPRGIDYSYQLKLVRVREHQTKQDAIVNNPPHYKGGNINQTSLPYPSAAPNLKEGETYAWQVAAFSDNYRIGRTQVWKFQVKKRQDSTQKETKEKKPQGDYFTLERNSTNNYYQVGKYLRFTIERNHKVEVLDFDFYNNEQQEITPDDLSLLSKYGENYYEINLGKYEAFKQGSKYALEITTMSKETYKLKFVYLGS
jgi:hypothetical protein